MWGLDGKGAGAGASTTAAPTPAGGTPAVADDTGGYLPAFVGGMIRGGADVINAPAAWMGRAPFVNADQAIVPAGQAAMAAHPMVTSAGGTAGQIAATLPIMLGTEALIPSLGAGALAARVASNPLVRSAVAGGIGGAEQNLLTAGEDPNESLIKRGGLGLFTGGLLGTAGGAISRAFGSGTALSPAAQSAGQTLADAKVPVTEANLPRATATVQTGAAATPAQTAALNTALSKTFGANTADFGADNMNALQNTMGPKINAAAAKGEIDPTVPGSTFLSDLANVENAARDPSNIMTDPERNGLLAHIGQIRQVLFDPKNNGVIPGAQFDSLTGAGSKVAKWADRTDDLGDVAQQLDDALRNGFKASSPPGVYDDWVNARTDYRLLQAVKKNVDPNGNVNPTTLFNDINQRFDIKSLPTSAGTSVAQARDLATAAKTAFGGGQGGPAGAPSLWQRVASPEGLAAAGGAAAYLLHHPIPAAAAATYLGARGLGALGQAYQRTPEFANRLIQTGSGVGPVVNALTSPASWARIGTAMLPGTVNSP